VDKTAPESQIILGNEPECSKNPGLLSNSWLLPGCIGSQQNEN
jgi:hypothetical protein